MNRSRFRICQFLCGFVMILSFSCKRNKQITINFECEDISACIEFEKKLKLIHDYNFLLKKIDYNKLILTGTFFERITNIKSNADIQIDGLQPPTILDYENWSAWYSQNYNCLKVEGDKVIVLQNCILDF